MFLSLLSEATASLVVPEAEIALLGREILTELIDTLPETLIFFHALLKSRQQLWLL